MKICPSCSESIEDSSTSCPKCKCDVLESKPTSRKSLFAKIDGLVTSATKSLGDNYRERHIDAIECDAEISSEHDMICTTGLDIPGKSISKSLGLCWGYDLRFCREQIDSRKGFTSLLSMAFKKGYIKECDTAQKRAINTMLENAKSMGANAIIGIRFHSTYFGIQYTEVQAYGTAVVVEDKPKPSTT